MFARRVFLKMLAATLLPMALFVWMGHRLLAQEAQARLGGRVVDENRHHAAHLRQRLVAARAVLKAVAERPVPASAPVVTGPAANAPGDLLVALARQDGDGRLLEGDGATVDRWSRAQGRGDTSGGLAWDGGEAAAATPSASASGVPPVASVPILLRHQASDGTRWLAQVSPSFLWAEAPGSAHDFHHCVTDGQGVTLHCTSWAGQALAATAPQDVATRVVSREWVLPGDFGPSAWQVITVADPAVEPLLDAPMLLRWTMLGAAVTLMLVGGMSWLEFRHTARSLRRLIDGTRRLAAQDWSTRVSLPSGDEFGRLADSLNVMAERIGRQMQATELLSAIDREILGGLDTARVMSLVARRLQALVPGTQAAVIVVGERGRAWQAYRADRDVPADLPPQAVPAVDEGRMAWTAPVEGVAAWAALALQGADRPVRGLCWLPAKRQGQLLALLVLGTEHQMPLAPHIQREMAELCDRTAVTLAAAARETALLERAVQDGLTGLLNRNGLHDAIDGLLQRGEPFTLVLVDLDRFKEVNDTLGHQAGDELLCAVSARLRHCVDQRAAIARPGGDEFVLLLPGEPASATAAALAICTELANPFMLRGVRQQIGGSVGLAACPQHGHSRVELMRRADMAMYHAKAEGRGRLCWYQTALDERSAHRAWMAQELRKAVDQSQFVLHFQPRVDAVSGQIVCAEVLLRWAHPERGLISPNEFVSAAEETGLIDRIGPWVMAAAFEQMSAWRRMGLPLKRIAVNVSPRQLRVPGFADGVLDMLARHQLGGSDVELELTENLFVGDAEHAIEALDPLRDAGVLVALDDFGTGYSSLSSLYRLPVDVIKIDRSFVSDLGVRPSADAVARSIVALAKALRKRVVAEGVETRSQRDHLLNLDCDELQGYLYARPMTAAQLQERLMPATPARAMPEPADPALAG